MLFWKDRQAPAASKALVSNRVVWEVLRMLKVYRHRWTGTETFHRDAKQQLGLGDCQVRSGRACPGLDPGGQTRHMYLVSVAYSLLGASKNDSLSGKTGMRGSVALWRQRINGSLRGDGSPRQGP